MKLKKYLEKLNNLVKEDESLLEVPVIYASDDEGNSYQEVCFSPCVRGVLDMNERYLETTDEIDSSVVKTVCVN